MTLKGDIEIKLELHPAQMTIFQSTARFVVVVAGRRFGKSWLAAVRAVTSAQDPNNEKGKAVWIITPTQQQGKAIYWSMLMNLLHPVIKKINSNEGLIYLNNGVEIGVKGADRPDTLRGVGLYDVILDEYATMKPNVWEEIIRPALADVKGRALFIGTPAGRNHFHELCIKACGGSDFPYSDGAPHSGDWQAFHYTSLDNPHLPEGEVEEARASLSSAAFRQEFMASFEVTGAGVFNRDWLLYVDEQPTFVDKRGETKKIGGDWYVVADLGSFAGITRAVGYQQKRLDRTAIWQVKVLDEEERKGLPRWYCRHLRLGRWGVKETAQAIVDACREVQTLNLGIEKGALYNAVTPEIASYAAANQMALRPEPLSHENQNKNDRVAWALQGRFEHGAILLQRAAWNRDFEDEYANFPSKMVHDDSMDALAFMPQLAKARVFESFAEEQDDRYWTPAEIEIGY